MHSPQRSSLGGFLHHCVAAAPRCDQRLGDGRGQGWGKGALSSLVSLAWTIGCWRGKGGAGLHWEQNEIAVFLTICPTTQPHRGRFTSGQQWEQNEIAVFLTICPTLQRDCTSHGVDSGQHWSVFLLSGRTQLFSTYIHITPSQ